MDLIKRKPRRRLFTVLLVGSVALVGLIAPWVRAASYGRIVGTVSDVEGNPLMGANVVIVGPLLTGLPSKGTLAERVLSDAHGRFAVERLIPGWYSLQITSATRLPAFRSRVRVDAGQTLQENFVLSDILAPLRLNVPTGNVSNWGEDWKWVLRTSSATRPILRYQQVARNDPSGKKIKPSLPASQRLVGMIPGPSRRSALTEDPGMGSVLAYLRPLSQDADLLVAGSMGTNGLQASSLATVVRRDLLKGDPQELALVVHQLSFAEGLPLPSGEGRESLSRAQALVLSYAQTRRLSRRLVLTGGMEINYLNAAQGALSTRPRVELSYSTSSSTLIAARYGTVRTDSDGSLLDRVGLVTAMTRVTLRDYRPRLEELNHMEVSLTRRLGTNSKLELAAYRDDFGNAAVWGVGTMGTLGELAGDFLPNPASNGVTLNAGNYTSSGLRAVYTQGLGSKVQVAFLYALGDALASASSNFSSRGRVEDLRTFLGPRRSQSFAGKVTARLPGCKTQIITSYEWLPPGRVTGVDPFGQAGLQLQPFWAVQIRQPLPRMAFFPARIEALADFRNLLAQGYVPVSQSGNEALRLTPLYRSFRGGFSVQF